MCASKCTYVAMQLICHGGEDTTPVDVIRSFLKCAKSTNSSLPFSPQSIWNSVSLANVTAHNEVFVISQKMFNLCF